MIHYTSPLHSPQSDVKGAISANIGKRRALPPPILCSPARQGHQSRVLDIFSKARAELGSMSDISASPRRSHLSLRLSVIKSDEVVKYPALGVSTGPALNLDHPTIACGAQTYHDPAFPKIKTENCINFEFPAQRGRRLSRDQETQGTPPPTFYPQRGLRRDAPYSAETLKPERYYANLGLPAEAPQSDTALSEASSQHTGSSASWTGDSDFYYSKPQPLPQQQRQSSVSEWLEQLPERLEKMGGSYNDDEEEEAPMSPLSFNVELERGNVRRRRIMKQVKTRCVSYDDEDIFCGED